MAGTNYVWDLGFDFNEVQKTDSLSFLRNGIVQMGLRNVPGSPFTLLVDDTLAFNVFNLTQGATSTSHKVLRVSLKFSNGGDSNGSSSPPSSPYAGDSLIQGDTFGTPNMGSSAIFSATALTVTGTNPLSIQFPFWTVPVPFQVVNAGTFLFTATVTAVNANDPNAIDRVFSDDPEMIVGSTE